jgi:D-aminoacyl-tRNA deacylase
MRLVIQRVKQASVEVQGEIVGQIQQGLLVLVGVHYEDTSADVQLCADKLTKLRIFSDEQGKMNLDLAQVNGRVLLVSQFTLYADIQKGRRPSFTNAAPPQLANELYQELIRAVAATGTIVEQGRFAADMQVSLINDGPVTILYDTRQVI